MSTVDEVQQTILHKMLRGEVQPGTWLRQDDLAAQLGVSKIPVREALQRLAAIGLLRFKPNRGVVVPHLSSAEAEESFGLRRAIEPLLLRRAIPQISIVDLAEAELALAGEGLTLTEANWAFHRALYAPSAWHRGLAMDEILHAVIAPYVALYTEKLGRGDLSHAQHETILEACRAGESDLACETLAKHLDDAASALTTFLEHSPHRVESSVS